eukprot:g14190.t1
MCRGVFIPAAACSGTCPPAAIRNKTTIVIPSHAAVMKQKTQTIMSRSADVLLVSAVGPSVLGSIRPPPRFQTGRAVMMKTKKTMHRRRRRSRDRVASLRRSVEDPRPPAGRLLRLTTLLVPVLRLQTLSPLAINNIDIHINKITSRDVKFLMGREADCEHAQEVVREGWVMLTVQSVTTKNRWTDCTNHLAR